MNYKDWIPKEIRNMNKIDWLVVIIASIVFLMGMYILIGEWTSKW